MRKAFALIDVGDTVVGHPFETREAAEAYKEGLSYFGDLLDVREIDYNDEPLDEEGEALKAELEALLETTQQLHFDKQIKWFEMSQKERIRTIINMLTLDDAEEVTDID